MKNKLLSFLKSFYIYIILLFIYIPLIIVVIISFCGQTDRGNIYYNFTNFSFENYPLLFEESMFINGLVDSLLLAIIVIPFVLIIATLACFGMWNSKKVIVKTVIATSNASIVSPEAITGISLLILFSATIVPMGFNLGFFTVILAHISFGVPYAIIAIYPKMSKMNRNLVLASYDLGYNKFQTFYKIIIPYLFPALISGAVISFAMSLDDYVITNLVNGDFQTIGTAIYSIRKGIKAWVVTFGSLVIMITIVFILINAIKIHFKEKVKTTKIKNQKIMKGVR